MAGSPGANFPELPEPQTPTAAFRIIFRDRLQSILETFLVTARPEEVCILHDVMVTWQSINCGDEGIFAECSIANALASAMQADHRFVKVPPEYRDLLQKQANAMRGLFA